jgi:YggT family protein
MFGQSLLLVIIQILSIYSWIILASALISWVYLPPANPIVRFLRYVTEPVLSPCRQLLNRILPVTWRRIDLSPILAMLLVQLVISLLRRIY